MLMTTSTTTRTGRLTPDQFGFSMPVGAPLYPPLPWQYRRARFFTVTYETDPDAVADVLPEGLSFSEPAVARVTFASYPETPVGPYNEALQTIECAWQGQPLGFVNRIVLDNDGALAAGREVLGYCKKLARVDWKESADALEVTVERGGGLIARVHATLDPVIPVGTESPSYTANIRLIPSAEAGAPPSVSELLRVSNGLFVHETRPAEATLEFGPAAETEAWSALPMRRILSAGLAVSDLTLNYGTVLARYV
jgi:acetoacetate decarboxylase